MSGDGAMKDRTLYLHGGGQGAGGPRIWRWSYGRRTMLLSLHNGKFYNGLVAVAFELESTW